MYNTWWERFHNAFDTGGNDEAHRKIDRRSTIVIGMLGLDAPHRGKPELHPVYAMFVRTDNNWGLVGTQSWAFFVRNWGNEGFCGEQDVKLHPHPREHRPIKVQIRDVVREVSRSGWRGARNADRTEISSMNFSVQPNPAGIELSFTLLPPEKQSWIVGDITFVQRPPLPDPLPPPFEAIRAQIDKLPKSSRKKLFAQLRSVVLRKGGKQRLPQPTIIAEPTEVGETHLKSPQKVDPKSYLVQLEKDSIGELNRRKQLEVIREFFAKRGVQVDLPPEK